MSKENNSNWFKKHKIATVVLVLLVIGVLGSLGGTSDDSNGSSGSNGQSSEAKETRFTDRADIQDKDIEVIIGEQCNLLYASKSNVAQNKANKNHTGPIDGSTPPPIIGAIP